MKKVGFRVTSSSSHNSSGISTLGSTGCGSLAPLMYQSMSALLHLGKSTAFGTLGVECFQPYQVFYVFLPSAFVPLVLSLFVAEHVTGHFTLLVVPCWIEIHLPPKVFNVLEDIPHWCPIIKISL